MPAAASKIRANAVSSTRSGAIGATGARSRSIIASIRFIRLPEREDAGMRWSSTTDKRRQRSQPAMCSAAANPEEVECAVIIQSISRQVILDSSLKAPLLVTLLGGFREYLTVVAAFHITPPVRHIT
ncbi:MAG: hypothetical protein JWP63_1063 [Candidatus Solibacter sp.]|nr:hypothetical protein [Candidatus Solibacter sp.]